MNDFFRSYSTPGMYQDLTDETFQDDDSQNIAHVTQNVTHNVYGPILF